jgi:cytochrome c-type biogenesis protein CcmF
LSEALRGKEHRLTVGPPFFNKWMLPIGLILLLLTGTGPLLAWRKSTVRNLLEQFLWPSLACVVTAIALYAFGVRVWTSGTCFALCAFVTTTVVQELIRGAQVRKGATGSDIVTAMIGLVGRSRRRYGGYVIHLGIMLMFLGFAGQGFKQEEQVKLNVGQQVTVGPFTVRHDALGVTSDAQKQMITGHVTIFERGKAIGTMEPARWFFAKHEDDPTTEVAIRRAPGEDLYIVLGGYEPTSQQATYAITINPLVNWIWLGFAVMALGTGLALLPESAFAFAAARIPVGAATTSLLLILLLLPARVQAQHVENPLAVPAVPQTQLEKEMRGEIICMCGTCGRKRIGECLCPLAAEMREEVAKMVAQGKSREEIYAYYIAKYGSQEPLASPIDEGFNRLAWFFPYLIGATGAASIAIVAFRWSRREDATGTPPAQPDAADDPTLRERLDDELRDLD